MTTTVPSAILAALTSALATLFLTPLAIRLAGRIGAIDLANDDRKVHVTPTPRFGGIAVSGGIAVGLFVALLLLHLSDVWPRVVWVGLACTLVLCIGMIDDFHELSAEPKLAVELIAGYLICTAGVAPAALAIPGFGTFALGGWAPVFAIGWLVLITNAQNLIDGVDGLASSQAALVSAVCAIVAALQGDRNGAIVAACVSGACLGFLRHNLSRATIFLGDGGSLLLGFCVGVLTLRMWTGTTLSEFAVIGPVLVLSVPLADTWMAFIRRAVAGSSPFAGDRSHLHHRLLQAGLSQLQVTTSLAMITGALALLALAQLADRRISVPLAVLVVLASVTAVAFAVREGLVRRHAGAPGASSSAPDPRAAVPPLNISYRSTKAFPQPRRDFMDAVSGYLRGVGQMVADMPVGSIHDAIERLIDTWHRGRTVFIVGNGGSAATASHLANDLTKLARVEGQRPIRAMALTDCVPMMTAWANDTDYSRIFAEQMAPFLEPGDCLLAISTSGRSENIIAAAQLARGSGASVIGFTGPDGGPLRILCDVCVRVPSSEIGQQEDAHLILAHITAYALRARILMESVKSA
jgi:UDP-GlcNAc:undecaprenyl-phosphate/decaprenyl-phosphate GlcNAc-1-phosphate transferase